MHPKTRYNIRLAAKKDVIVREAVESDLPAFNSLMEVTGERDGFSVHSAEYYAAAFQLFAATDQAKLFVATFEERVIAGLFVFALGDWAWYFYGASGEAERQRMPDHGLQWRTCSGPKRAAAKNMTYGAFQTKTKRRSRRITWSAATICGACMFQARLRRQGHSLRGRLRSGVRSRAISGVQAVFEIARETE